MSKKVIEKTPKQIELESKIEGLKNDLTVIKESVDVDALNKKLEFSWDKSPVCIGTAAKRDYTPCEILKMLVELFETPEGLEILGRLNIDKNGNGGNGIADHIREIARVVTRSGEEYRSAIRERLDGYASVCENKEREIAAVEAELDTYLNSDEYLNDRMREKMREEVEKERNGAV